MCSQGAVKSVPSAHQTAPQSNLQNQCCCLRLHDCRVARLWRQQASQPLACFTVLRKKCESNRTAPVKSCRDCQRTCATDAEQCRNFEPTAHTAETCATAAQTHRMTSTSCDTTCMTRDRGVPISSSGAATLCSVNVNSTGWEGKKQLAVHALVKVVLPAHSETSTLTVDVLSVANESIRDAELFPARNGLALSSGMRRAAPAAAALPSTLKPLWQPTLRSYRTRPRHEGVQRWRESPMCPSLDGTCELHSRLNEHRNSRSTQWVHPARHPGLRNPRCTCSVLRVHAVILSVSCLEAWAHGRCHVTQLGSTMRLAILRHAHESAWASARVCAHVVVTYAGKHTAIPPRERTR